MQISEREKHFKKELLSKIGIDAHVSPGYGTSNIARMVPGGFVVCVSNLDNLSSNTKAILFISRLCPLPNTEIYIGALIQSDIHKLHDRLMEMLDRHNSGDDRFKDRNNNVSICIGPDSSAYAYNTKISELSSPPQDFLGEGIGLDSIHYSIYCENPKSEEKLLIKGLLESLTTFFGSQNFFELPAFGRFGFLKDLDSKKVESLSDIYKAFCDDLEMVNLSFDRIFVGRLIASLLTKRFVILTGLSGSGKTKLAQALATWFSSTDEQFRLVAVGADWTNNENVLGYQDALQPDIYRRPSNGALDVILAAAGDPDKPYFLILDEMNLSHVERYFADILSAIESKQKVSLHSCKDSLSTDGNESLLVPPCLALPENLFIMGTVNVDETTYMFSPKVLDRANVLEFRVSEEEIGQFLEAPRPIKMDLLEGRGSAYGRDFVEMASTNIALMELPEEIADPVVVCEKLNACLCEIFKELQTVGAEFGYRTAFEISQFVFHHANLFGDDWIFEHALDAQVIQKIMPKLHGSDRRLRPTLEKLKTFCEEYGLALSLEKTERMLKRLSQDGFTSFAEA